MARRTPLAGVSNTSRWRITSVNRLSNDSGRSILPRDALTYELRSN